MIACVQVSLISDLVGPETGRRKGSALTSSFTFGKATWGARDPPREVQQSAAALGRSVCTQDATFLAIFQIIKRAFPVSFRRSLSRFTVVRIDRDASSHPPTCTDIYRTPLQDTATPAPSLAPRDRPRQEPRLTSHQLSKRRRR